MQLLCDLALDEDFLPALPSDFSLVGLERALGMLDTVEALAIECGSLDILNESHFCRNETCCSPACLCTLNTARGLICTLPL